MRVWMLVGALLLLSQPLLAQEMEGEIPSPEQPRRLQIALLELEVTGGIDSSLARPISDRFRQELFRTGRFTVVERNTMEQILEEQSLHLAGCMSDQCVVEAGRILGVEQMVAGSISRIGSVITVNARLIDVQTTRLTAAESVDCNCDLETVLTESLGQLAGQLADAVDPNGDLAYASRNGRDIHMPDTDWEWVDSVHGWGSVTASWLERTGFAAIAFPFGWSIAPFQDPTLSGSVGNGLYLEFPAFSSFGYMRPALILTGGGMSGNKDFYDHSYSEGGITFRMFNYVLHPRRSTGLYSGVEFSMLTTYVSVEPDDDILLGDIQHGLAMSQGGGDVRLGLFVGSRFDLDWDIGGRSLFTFIELRAEGATKQNPEPNPIISISTGLGWKLNRR